jgi:hypothetical protein
MGFPKFAWVWSEIGVNSGSWRYEQTIPVPLKGTVLVLLQDAEGVQVPSGDAFVDVVDPTSYSRRGGVLTYHTMETVQTYLASLNVAGSARDDLLNNLWPDVQNELRDGTSKLLKVTGKAMGRTQLTAGSAAQWIEVIPSTTYKLAFRFQQRPANTTQGDLYDKDGNAKPQRFWTDLNVTQVDEWTSNLNWIFGSQAGITMDVVSKAPFTMDKPFSPSASGDFVPDGTRSMRFVEQTQIVYEAQGNVDDKAEDMVFMTGSVLGAKAFTVPPRTHKPFGSYLPDRPRDRMATKVDPFIVILAHEISHAIQREGFNQGTHLCRDGVLRSAGAQSTIIGDELRPKLISRLPGSQDPTDNESSNYCREMLRMPTEAKPPKVGDGLPSTMQSR